jgi:hypothetical protein
VELVEAYLDLYQAGIERAEILNHFKYMIVYQTNEWTEMDLYMCNDKELEELLSHFRRTGILRFYKPWLDKIEEVKPIRVAVYEIKEYYRKRNLITG